MKILKSSVVYGLFLFISLYSVSAFSQNISAIKEAQTVDGSTLTSLEVGQQFQYRLVWNCSFTNTPPPEGCGDFLLEDILPEGLDFVSCTTTSDYTCTNNAGVVEIDKVGGASGVNLGAGESSEAFIVVELSSDLNDYAAGVFPDDILNNATVTGSPDQDPVDATATTPVNAPENNWEVSKEDLIPALPINPALDNPVVYRIEVCPNGPAGIGTGTIPITNTILTDTCEAGALFVGAELNGSPFSPTAPAACPNLEFNLGDLDPVDGCAILDVTLEYPTGAFAEGDIVQNMATAVSDEGDVGVCELPCTNVVEQEISAPNPDGNISKSTRRSELAVGALSQYTIRFNLNDSNVLLNNVVVQDIFPTNITVTNFNFGGWDDDTVIANITELGTGIPIATAYDGSTTLNVPLDPAATGFIIEFITPVPPGFDLMNASGQTTSVRLNFQLDSVPVPGPDFENCVILSADELVAPSEDCATVTVIEPRADIQSIKTMPDALNPGEEFTATFALNQDFTSTEGAVNPVVVECLPPELLFVSWDDVDFTFGLDDPRDPINLTNDLTLGVLPNIEVFAPGDPGNVCTSGGGMLRWTWSNTAPANSLALGNGAAVANPFTFPVYPDRNGDNQDTAADAPLGELSRVTMEVTLQVAPGTAAQSGLENISIIEPENENFACISGATIDTQDLDGDGDTAETICQDVEPFSILSAAAIGGQKFVGGVPTLENIDPDNPPANADAANVGIEPSFCPDDGFDRTRTPCVAQGLASQPFNYQVRLSNNGNVPLVDYVAYDIFPYANDVGIIESQATAARGSTWTPQLLGPIVLSSANPIVQAELNRIGDLTITPASDRPRVEYSASTNPCRDELSIAADNPWQGGVCDDDWTEVPLADPLTFPNGYASVAAWRLVLPFADNPWPQGSPTAPLDEDIVVDIPMLAQVNAPASDYDAGLLEIAWNNIGHRATNSVSGGRLLASEVRRSGIVIPEDFPINSVGVRLGNLVWMDTDNDGIAELGEPGLFDVTVELWQDLTGDGPSADDILFDTQQTDALGHYLFDDSNPNGPDGIPGNADDVRDNLGFDPGSYYVVIPDAQTGTFDAAQFYSSTGAGDELNADGNIDNDDNGASDLTGSPITTASGDVIEGIHSNTVVLDLVSEPVDEINRSDDSLTDDDTDFFTDEASNVSVDFGFYQLRLGNHVWLDTDNDGIADGNENAIENLLVELWIDNGDGVFDPTTDIQVDGDPSTPAIDPVVTDAAGQYVYEGLEEGEYFVAIPESQTGLISDGDTYSTDGLISSTPAAGDLTDDNVDDGTPGTFGGTDYASVSPLYVLEAGVAALQESDTSNDGVTGASSTDFNDPNVELSINLANTNSLPDENSFLTADFGFVPLVSLGSTVWEDIDANGIQDPNEAPIVGATVTLLDAAGVPVPGVPPVTTNADGEYNFNDLLPGTYRVEVDLSTVTDGTVYLPTPIQEVNADNDSNTDSNIDFSADTNTADLVHISAPIELVAGDEPTDEQDAIGVGAAVDDMPNQDADDLDASGNMTLDLGFVPAVSLGSTLWNDLDGNGLQDAGEPAIEGAEITLFNADGTVFDSDPFTAGIQSLVVTTNADGEYNFNELPAGSYFIQANLATATNANALTFVPTPIQEADANTDLNTDSNIDTTASLPANVFQSAVIDLLAGTEPIEEEDLIGTPGTDQPSQNLIPGDGPDANGNMTLDLGFIEPVSLGSTVWLDANANGLQEAGELPIAGVTVTLLDALGVPVAGVPPVITDANGEYNFNGLVAGDYQVQVDLSSSAFAGALDPSPVQVVNPENDNDLDSNIAVNNSVDVFTSGVVTLELGTEPTAEANVLNSAGTGQPNQASLPDNNGNMTVDFGFIQPVSIGSRVWEDLNGDGLIDAGETPIAGATVTLLDSAGNPVAATVTDAQGQYNFNDLPPGTYQVQVDLSTVAGGGDLFATPIQEPNADTDLNNDSNIASNPSGQIYVSGPVTLLAGTEPTSETDLIGADQPNQGLTAVDQPDESGNMTVDFGFVRPVSLGSTVWQDTNADGVQDIGEEPIIGATVTLLDSSGNPVPGISAVTTDANGEYSFNDLPPGDYRVQVDLSTVAGGGSLIPTLNQVADPDVAGDDNTDSNIDAAFDTNLVDQIHTSGIVTLTAGGEPIGEADPIDSTNPAANLPDQPGQTAANPDNSGNMTVDFGFYAPVSIGSFVWEDLNGDGIQDANEPPLAGSVVELVVETAPGSGVFVPAQEIGGTSVAPVTVGANGLYEFTNLPPGGYKVQVTPPSGFFPSPVQTATDDDDTANDSNIASEPSAGVFESGLFNVDSGTEPNEIGPDANRGDSQDGAAGSAEDLSGNMTIDFGFVALASIGNYVWLDLDMDGVQDANEDGIPGVVVTLTPPAGVDAGNGPGVPITATTGPNGEYLFPDLPPFVSADPSEGYVVTVDPTTLPSGLVQTYDEGVVPASLGSLDNSSEPIQLDPNEEHLTADFGYAPPIGSIGDTIWIDANDDGVQNPGEQGIAGVVVTLTDSNGNVQTTTTDANGNYLFTNLPLDEVYVVEVDTSTLPVDYVLAPSGLGDPDVRDDPAVGQADNQTTILLTVDDPVNLDADFGYLPPADQNNSVGDTVWIDANADGVYDPATETPVSGVTISLIDSAGNVVSSQITDANGEYLFTGVPDGVYTVEVTDQNNVLAGLDPTFDDDGLATPNTSVVDLDSAGASTTPVTDLDQDFGYVDPNNTGEVGTIGDTIFFDADASGTPDAGEGLEGVVVELFDDNGVLIASTTTDENGNYLFTGLEVSPTGVDYEVIVDVSTLPNGGAGWSNTVDPDGGNDSSSLTTLTTAAPIDLDQDFGYLGEDGNTLTGTVFQDDDGDGEQNEPDTFAGVTIEILDENGNVVQTVVTDANGDYEVTNLPDGVYTVVVTDEDNVLAPFEHTDSPNGPTDTSDETSKDDTGYVVDLDSAGAVDVPVTDETGDFGYEPSVTNPISLGSFNATLSGSDVVFTWVTQTEVSNLGFNLYASIDDEWVVLNDSLILSQGDSVSLQEYSLTLSVEASAFALSDVDVEGKETLHGPFLLGETYGTIGERQAIDWSSEKGEREAKEAAREAERLEQQRQRNLERRLRNSAPRSDVDGVQLKNEELSMQYSEAGWLGRTAALVLSALIPSAHAATLAEEVVNLETVDAGIHSVSYADLADYGLEGIDVGEFALLNKGESVPVYVVGSTLNPAVFGEGASIRFIAEQVDTLYSDTNVYTLGLDAVNATAANVKSTAVPTGAAANAYLAKASFAPQNNYSFASPDEDDPWSASQLVRRDEPVSETVTLELDGYALGGNTGSTQAKLRVNVWGMSSLGENDHHVQVSMNGKQVMSERFAGLTEQEYSVNLDNVSNGSNRVTVSLPVDTGYDYDAVSMNEVEVNYPREFAAIDGRLSFESTFNKFQISEVPSSAEYVVMTEQDGVVEVETNVESSRRCSDVCSIQFAGRTGVTQYYVSTLESLHEPVLAALPLEQNITQGQAKYLVISHPDFIGVPSLTNFMSDITAEMGSAKLVDVEAIYAQFGDHLFDPAAIQAYIGYATANLGTEYVLLVGGDVYDYRQFENEDATSFIPSIYAPTGNNINFAPVDAKYVDLDDDNVPDLAIGRLPVRTEAQLNSLMSKRASYLSRDYQGKVLMVADEYDDLNQYDFAGDADEIATTYLSGSNISTAYVDEVGVSQARATAIAKINEGQSLTAFFGHSSTNQWAFNGLFTGNDAASLNNIGKPTVVTQWGCWNAYYVSPNEDSMGHRFMMEGDQGAVSVMGATTLTDASSERALATLVFENISNGQNLGDAILNAKQAYALVNPSDLDVLLGWSLLGFPETVVNSSTSQ